MANTTTNDLLSAIDSYMKSNGRGMNYIASKMADIFDNKDAPLNPKSGPLSLIQEIFEDLQIAMETLYKGPTSVIPAFKKEMGWVNKSVKKFNTKLKDVLKSMDTFDNYILNLVTVGKSRTTKNTPYNTSQTGYLKVTIHNFNQSWIRTGIPVYIRAISADVVKKLGQGTPEKVLLSAPTSSPIPKPSQPNVDKDKDKNQQQDKKESGGGGGGGGGILSSIIGFLATSAALIGGLGYIATEMDKTPAGKEMKERIKKVLGDSVSSIFDKIGGFISKIPEKLFGMVTDEKTQSVMSRGISILYNGLSFVIGEFYDRVIGKLIDEGKVSMAKFTSAIGLTFAKNIFNKLTFGLFNITSHIKWLDTFVTATKGVATAASHSPGGILKSLKNVMIKVAPKLLKVLRFIPGIGFILSLGFAIQRIRKGDIIGGLLEIVSGIAYQFAPTGVGLALGIGIDAFNAFLDYKQESQPGKGKGAIIIDMFGAARTWIENKLGISMRNIPVLGGMIRFGEAIEKMSSDPLEGMKLLLESLWWSSPTSALNGAWSFIQFIQGTKVAKTTGAPIKNKISGWFNPTSVIDQVTSWTKNLYNSAMSIFDSSPKVDTSSIAKGTVSGADVSKVTPVAVNDATIIQPDSKDQILMAKTGGPFDLAMKQMNRMMNEKFDELINIAAANVQATMSGSKAIVQTVASTAGSNKGSAPMPSFNGSDPIRAMRNQVNNFVH